MSYRLHSHPPESQRPRRIAIQNRWLIGCLTILAGSLAASNPLCAGPDTPPRPKKKVICQICPKATPMQYNKDPYLLVYGPLGVQLRAPANPRFRHPPLLPVPKEKEAAAVIPNLHEGGSGKDGGPDSALLSDPSAPPISVPRPPIITTSPAPTSGEPPENALTNSAGKDPDLKDAVIYFEAPIGKKGGSVTVPVPMNSQNSTTAPSQSSATYQEKE